MASRRCGPWRETQLGKVRRCNNPLLPEESEPEVTPAEQLTVGERTQKTELVLGPDVQWRALVDFGFGPHWIGTMPPPDDDSRDDPDPEATPALPERKTPPGIEWRSNTQRTQEIARKLIESVFGPSEGEQS